MEDANMVNIVSNLIGSLGFPIFVAVWQLMKSSKESASVTEALNKLEQAIVLLNQKIGKGD